jgi:hypothetical protein
MSTLPGESVSVRKRVAVEGFAAVSAEVCAASLSAAVVGAVVGAFSM